MVVPRGDPRLKFLALRVLFERLKPFASSEKQRQKQEQKPMRGFLARLRMTGIIRIRARKFCAMFPGYKALRFIRKTETKTRTNANAGLFAPLRMTSIIEGAIGDRAVQALVVRECANELLRSG